MRSVANSPERNHVRVWIGSVKHKRSPSIEEMVRAYVFDEQMYKRHFQRTGMSGNQEAKEITSPSEET